MLSLSASPAAVFRTLADRQITLLFDEVDSLWSERRMDDNQEDLRALLNAGYKRGATIPRCVGPRHEVQHFCVFGCVALAGLRSLRDTIISRAIITRIRLLADLRIIYGDADAMHSETILRLRTESDLLEPDAPWADLPGTTRTKRPQRGESRCGCSGCSGNPHPGESLS